jgi:hypothetical protein
MCEALPSTTSSAGYACPSCKTPIVPSHSLTLLARRITQTLAAVPWALRLKEIEPTPTVKIDRPAFSSGIVPQRKSQVAIGIDPDDKNYKKVQPEPEFNFLYLTLMQTVWAYQSQEGAVVGGIDYNGAAGLW